MPESPGQVVGPLTQVRRPSDSVGSDAAPRDQCGREETTQGLGQIAAASRDWSRGRWIVAAECVRPRPKGWRRTDYSTHPVGCERRPIRGC